MPLGSRLNVPRVPFNRRLNLNVSRFSLLNYQLKILECILGVTEQKWEREGRGTIAPTHFPPKIVYRVGLCNIVDIPQKDKTMQNCPPWPGKNYNRIIIIK